MVTFFALILMFAASPILVPVDVKQHPIVYRGSSKPAATPVVILGPDRDAPDSTQVQDEPPLPAPAERGDDSSGESPSGEDDASQVRQVEEDHQ